MLTRRTLLQSTAGATAATIIGRRARAVTSPPNSSGRDAVTFNNTWLSNSGIPGMPTSLSPKGIIHINWRCTASTLVGTTRNIIQTNGNSIAHLLGLAVTKANDGSTRLQLTVTGTTGSDDIFAIGPAASLNVWNQDVIGFDMSIPTIKWLSNGNTITPQVLTYGSNWSINYAQPWAVGAQGQSGRTVLSPFIGDMADLTLWAAAYVDPTDPLVLPSFFDVANEVPKRIGPTGWGTLDAFGNLRPQICLSGPASQFMQNLTAGQFDPMGGVPTYYDTTPTSMFTLSAGSLVTAASDPWGDPT